MFEFTFPSEDTTRSVINGIRGVIGRTVEFLTETKVACSGCTLNPITGDSADPFCVVCDGLGYIITYSGTTISGHVTWGKSDFYKLESGGSYPDGDCRVQIEYTDDNAELAENASYILVDNRRLRITDVIPRGVPTLNRILVDLMVEDTE